jgi:hypothetical protein
MKHHSDDEIVVLLRRARELQDADLPLSVVCKRLDISVMTLHRWRSNERSKIASDLIKSAVEENRMLRKVATDLLMEIAQLRETSEMRRAA